MVGRIGGITMANSQKEIAMLAGNGDGRNSPTKYNAIDRFFSRHPALVLEILIAIFAMIDGFVIGGRYGSF